MTLAFVLSFIVALLTNQGAPISKAELSGDLWSHNSYPVFAYEWPNGPCGEDYCWLTVTDDGYATWNHGEIRLWK